jgi:enoyl-[acyl-carrier protein] reductase II
VILIRQAHDVGALVTVQVTTVGQAVQAAERGVDVIIAQGSEAGGYGGTISTMALVPQVVDAVSPVPLVAAGGIYDGRGIAAAFMLGAVGVNMGTRFLASKEAPIDDDWKQAIIELRRGQRRETLVWAGQTAGGVKEILPVADIMRQLVDETEAALARVPRSQ